VNSFDFVLHGLSWLAPTWVLTGFILLHWRWSWRKLNLRWGWWGNAIALLFCGLAAQGLGVWCWGWPDGSMAGDALLLVTLALAQALLTSKK
jgi:hypothetical protein